MCPTQNSANTYIVATATNEVTKPVQPAFLAYAASTVLNKFGNVWYYLGTAPDSLTEVFDQNADFNVNGTLVAPITGRYKLMTIACATGLTNAYAASRQMLTSNRTYENVCVTGASSINKGAVLYVFADMDAGDTAVSGISSIGDDPNTSDLLGGAVLYSFFCGYLLC